jgi:hypothetical protein
MTNDRLRLATRHSPLATRHSPLATRHSPHRRTAGNRDERLWNNDGTWWLRFTLLSATGGSKRHRISLKTRDLGPARTRRDRIIAAMESIAPAASRSDHVK